MDEKLVIGLAAELGRLRIVAGNEANKTAKLIVTYLEKSDPIVKDMIGSDELDVDEIKKDLKAMMQAIVAMSKMLETNNKSINDLRTAIQTTTVTSVGGGVGETTVAGS